VLTTFVKGHREIAKPMQFPDASGVRANLLFPCDGSYFEMRSCFIDSEVVEPADVHTDRSQHSTLVGHHAST
jgi:hypothetical protein